MSGILYVCATPIGNMEDITLRVLNVLKSADIIACEDTRRTIKLLNHYDIKNKLTSYHEHNKRVKGAELIETLLSGKNIALVTDAGMPGISDPGSDLVKLCLENNINVTCCPGATAAVCALVLSGLDTRRYVFEGFLPSEKKERKKIVNNLSVEQRTIVLYESPHHLADTLAELRAALGGSRKAALVREITKMHEQVLNGTLDELTENAKENARGEYAIVIEGAEEVKTNIELTIEEHMEVYLGKGFDKKEAMKLVAKDRGVSKSEIYASIVKGGPYGNMPDTSW